MSEHNYQPKSKFGKWFNDRLPLLTLANHLTDYPTPKNLNYWWTFGGILTFCLITQIITGLVLAMHYIAHADLDFINKIGLKEQLSATRANGLLSMIKQMKLYAIALDK